MLKLNQFTALKVTKNELNKLTGGAREYSKSAATGATVDVYDCEEGFYSDGTGTYDISGECRP